MTPGCGLRRIGKTKQTKKNIKFKTKENKREASFGDTGRCSGPVMGTEVF
jgi:hypothetical protein